MKSKGLSGPVRLGSGNRLRVCCYGDEHGDSGMLSTEWHQQSDPKAAWRLVISTKIDRIEGHFVCVFGRGRPHAALGWVALV